MNRYYQLTKANNSASISIYGDITSYPWKESDVSASNLSRQIDELQDVDEISVYINSYGGMVAEGLAIYNALKRHKAKVKTYCDGFAASIASVIFMAGDERIMNDSSLLMIHNAWSWCEGNAKELRKQADDLDKITRASVIAYKAHSSLSEQEIEELMDNESWILPDEALKYGFATAIAKTEQKNASQNARHRLFELIKAAQEVADEDESGENAGDDKESQEDENAPENAVESPVEASTDDEETPEDESADNEETPGEEPGEEDSEEENPDEAAAQRLSGLFNAFLKFEGSMRK